MTLPGNPKCATAAGCRGSDGRLSTGGSGLNTTRVLASDNYQCAYGQGARRRGTHTTRRDDQYWEFRIECEAYRSPDYHSSE